jgi:NADH:ubiquinone oxidoreductase subunit
MGLFNEFFTWWNGNTWGTRFFTYRKGKLIGEDEFGNRYYEQRSGVGPLGIPRRWVIYNGLAEASTVPADWHGWLHYTVDEPPSKENYQARHWQKRHQPNYTGTSKAYRPAGSVLADATSKSAPRDYEPWQPE